MRSDIITIDGPTSSGKNSVGFLLSKKLGYQYIDTGMIYRAGCYNIIKQNIPLSDEEKILHIFRNLNIEFKTVDDSWRVFSDRMDVTDILHTPQISKTTSLVAAIPRVREIMKGIQRGLDKDGKIVMGGRDIGSEIFPDAQFKFFLTASVEVRAKRRFKQLIEKDSSIKYEDVLKDMIGRDKNDEIREASPMRIPQGAVVIDNSTLSVEQTVDQVLKHIQHA